jgi:excisionase family DNA binding protein
MSNPKTATKPLAASTERFLTPAELANRWKVTPITLRRWRKDGKLKVLNFGRGVRVAISEVERFEAEASV